VIGLSFRFNQFRAAAAAIAAALPFLAASAFAQEEPGPGYAEPGQIGLQSSVTPIMDSIVAFHDGLLMWIISAITLVVLGLLIWVMVRYNRRANPTPSRTTHNTLIEIVWTVVPIVILIVIAVPSFGVLADQLMVPDGERKYLGKNIFSFGEVDVPAPELTVKATGVQWNWQYDYVDFEDADFSSFMLNEEERQSQKPGEPRLLATDTSMVVPVDTTVRLQVTAADVIHAFAVPSFGVRIDAVPGRLNETWFHARTEGVYYGQCSELCGKDHAYMPISVRVVSQDEFDAWLEELQANGVMSANEQLGPIG